MTGVSATGRRTLDDVFDPSNNSLNALRLLLASLVIVSHASPLTSDRGELLIGGGTLGGWAVMGFFVISGFLITRSRERRGLGRFFWDRFLRIYPGYMAALCVCAFVFAPLSLLLTTGTVYELQDGLGYVAKNLALSAPFFKQEGIGNTLAPGETGLPLSGVWDGPVWTLFYEAVCYVVVALVMTVMPRRWLGPVFIALAIATTACTWATAHDVLTLPAAIPTYLFAAFAVGAALYWYRDRIPMGPVAAGVAAFALLDVCAIGEAGLLGPLPLGIVLFFLAARLPLQRVGRVHDLSYGVYIYGWPVQILVMLAALRWAVTVQLGLDVVLVLAITLVLAYGSARLIEEPALRLKSLGRPGNARNRPPSEEDGRLLGNDPRRVVSPGRLVDGPESRRRLAV